MSDPFLSLHKSIQNIFHFTAPRNGKYTFPALQQLQDAIDAYNPKAKNSFINLLRSIREALPYIEKSRISFEDIQKPMDAMAKLHHMPTIDWNKVLSHPNVSPRFQFSALNHSRKEDDLIVWITARTGRPFAQLDHREITQALVDNRDRHGFSQKLNQHLKKNPDFLFDLIMKSERNFIKISHTRLILYLTDEQLAKAIIKHIPSLVHKRKEPFDQVEQLVHTLNEILSNGRSVATLLRNAEAKPILDTSVFFQMYQSAEFKNRHEHRPVTDVPERSNLNPQF